MNKFEPGATVALTLAAARTAEDGDEVKITGLFTIDEFHPYEPSAYVWTPFFTVYDAHTTFGREYYVDEIVMIEQVDPKLHGQILQSEREMLHAQEQQDMEDRFGR